MRERLTPQGGAERGEQGGGRVEQGDRVGRFEVGHYACPRFHGVVARARTQWRELGRRSGGGSPPGPGSATSAGRSARPQLAAELGGQRGGVGVAWSAGRSRRARWSARPTPGRGRPPEAAGPHERNPRRMRTGPARDQSGSSSENRAASSFGLGLRKMRQHLEGVPAVRVEGRADQDQAPDQRRGCRRDGRRLGAGGQPDQHVDRLAGRARSPRPARGRSRRGPRVRRARPARAAGRRRSRPAAAARPAPPRTCARPGPARR